LSDFTGPVHLTEATLLFCSSPLLSGFSRPSIPQPIAAFFPLSPGFRFLRCYPSTLASRLSPSIRPVSMPSFWFRYSALCSSFLPLTSASQRLSRSCPLAFRFNGFPLAFALGSVPWLVCFELSVRLRPHMYCHRNYNLAIPIFIFFNYCLVFYNQLIIIFSCRVPLFF